MDSGDAGSQWDARQRLIACIGLVLAFGFVLRKLIVPVSAPSPLHEAAVSILVQWVTSAIVAVIAFKWLRLNRSELGLRVPRPLDWPIALATLVLGMIAAGVVSSVFPGVFGWTSSLLTPCVLGLFLTLLFLLRKNLIIGMVVHALVDAIGLILIPMASTKA